MTINADTLLDRLYLKGQVNKWRILAIGCAVIALIVLAERYFPHSPMERDYVARLTLDGIILDDQRLYDLIDEVGGNPRVKALIVWLDTPGGSAVAGEEVFIRLRALSGKKPVVAVMRSVAASAGYMIALGADHIVAREGTITGSIGVLIETAEITALAEKLGIKPIVIKSAPLKGTPNPLEKSTPESERMLQQVIDDFYNRFVTMTSERRKLPRGLVMQLADGRIFSGKRAVESKLIDALGGESEAMQWLVQQKRLKQGLEIRDVEIPQEANWLEALTQGAFGKFFQNSSIGLDGLVAIWHPQLH